jgi:chemotaxis protein MotB
VLEQNPDIVITIEGHTDDVPVRSNPSFQDNWDLSVKRATSIVRILLDHSSINPQRLIASGRSEYLPVDPRTDPVARQKNRRTEIILTPRLDELYKLIESR